MFLLQLTANYIEFIVYKLYYTLIKDTWKFIYEI